MVHVTRKWGKVGAKASSCGVLLLLSTYLKCITVYSYYPRGYLVQSAKWGGLVNSGE